MTGIIKEGRTSKTGNKNMLQYKSRNSGCGFGSLIFKKIKYNQKEEKWKKNDLLLALSLV